MKALVRNNPTRPVSMWDDMDRIFNTFFDETPSIRYSVPSVDVREEEGRYLLEAELPGLTEKEVDVKVDDNLLTISSRHEETREGKSEEKKPNYLIRERKSSSFSRSFVLPKDVDPEKINGSFADGVLSLTLDKRPEAKPKEIKIRSAK